MMSELAEKREALRRVIAGCVAEGEKLLVAYSGGVDSAYLAWAAHEVLGERMMAVIADSASLPRRELAAAVEFAERHGIALKMVQTGEVQQEKYARNDAARCYYCKDELFRVMEEFAGASGMKMAYGRNLDDDGEFRPGQRAAGEHGVLAPLAMAGLGKAEVRELAREAGLEVWDKPASACLSSRIEPGRAVTVETLRQVEMAEEAMRGMGFRQVRVRHHGEMARVEIDRAEMARALTMEMMERIAAGVRACGFKFVAVDADGYRTGSMNMTGGKLVRIETLSVGG